MNNNCSNSQSLKYLIKSYVQGAIEKNQPRLVVTDFFFKDVLLS